MTILAGLAGALLLARGRREGLALMESTPEGAWRSFVAALLGLPLFLVPTLLGWSTAEVQPVRGLAAALIGYSIAWSGFALVSLPIATGWGRRHLWPRFIAAWNWTNVVQYVVFLLLSLLGFVDGVAEMAGLVAIAYVLWLEWFVARNALGVDGLRAALLVGVDLLLGVFLVGLIRALGG